MLGTGGGMEGGSLHVTSGLPWFWPRWMKATILIIVIMMTLKIDN